MRGPLRTASPLNFDVEVDKARFQAAAALSPGDGLRSLGNPSVLVIDEPQRLPETSRIIKGWHDARLPAKFLLLGSSSLDLLDQAAESLTGRNPDLVLPPLLFSETLVTQAWANADATPGHLCQYRGGHLQGIASATYARTVNIQFVGQYVHDCWTYCYKNSILLSVITAMDIRDQMRADVLDYQQLVSCLRGYSKPRDRISGLLADGSLVRVRKGLYVFGQRYRHAPLSREHLANLIYGPSYVSLDYALSRYGLVPERVENVTSVTTGENRRFSTPFGDFSYRPLPLRRYSPGIRWAGEGDAHYLMASPEKALVDKVWADKRFSPANLKDFEAYLFEDLRLDEEQAAALDRERLATICAAFASRKIDMLARCLARQRGVSS